MGFGRYFMSSSYSEFNLSAAQVGKEMETVVPPSVCLPVAVIALFCPISIPGLSPLRRTGLIRFRVGHVRTTRETSSRDGEGGDGSTSIRTVRPAVRPSFRPSVRPSVCQAVVSRPRIIEGATSPSAGCSSPLRRRNEGGRTSIETAAMLGFWFRAIRFEI